MKKRTLSLLLVTVMAISTMLTGCGNSAGASASESGSTLAVVTGPEPDTIDPALNSSVDGGTMIVHAFEGLMTLDENAQPIYGQAESYEVSEMPPTFAVCHPAFPLGFRRQRQKCWVKR